MATTQKGTLLRILRNDTPDPDQYVLLHITPMSSSQPLNLQLHATDGERAFGLKLKQSKINEFRAKSYTGTISELEQILSSLLLKSTITNPQLILRGIELAASAEGDSVTLTIRQDIGGIKQRIAALKIPEVEDDIPIFEWAVEACGVMDDSAMELQSLQSRVALQEKDLTKLTNQLTALVALKKEHEETLLAKFSELLNSKKSKIRELNQLLENTTPAASKSPSKEPLPPPIRTSRAKPAPKTTTARKRKSIAPPNDSESDGFVKMDLDTKGEPAAPADGETEDSEDSEGRAKMGDYLRPNAQSDRSATEDEDELPPPRKPPGTFTLRAPEKRTPEPETQTQTQAGGEEPKAAVRGRGARVRVRVRGVSARVRGRGRASQSPPAVVVGRRQSVRGKAKEASPEASLLDGWSGGDTDDDEL